MKRMALACMGLALLVGCSWDNPAGERYRAERDLWQADWEMRNLSLRTQEVARHHWATLAQRYESIAERYPQVSSNLRDQAVEGDIQRIRARALFAAAQVYTVLRDSIRIEALYEQIAHDYAQIDQIAAEVAFAQAGIAGSRGRFLEAAGHYQTVIARTPPQPGEPGVRGVVLGLPLVVARLRAQAAGEATAQVYEDARTYYEGMTENHPGSLIQVESQTHLAELSADLGDWDGAVARLEVLEEQLASMDEPPREPCAVRFAIAGIHARFDAGLDASNRTLLSLLDDYPDCGLKPRVLLTLANNANKTDRVEEALDYLGRIGKEHKDDEEIAAQALMARGRMLEQRGRWQEALTTFRELSVQYPLVEISMSAPLEIAQHYARMGEREAESTALAQAEERYRDLISRYPPGPQSIVARERLVQSLMLQGKQEDAVTEMENLGADLTGRPEGLSYLLAAARMAQVDLADTLRAAGILERTGTLYAETEVGQWARAEAERMRGRAPQ